MFFGSVRESLIKSEKQVHHSVRRKCRKSLVSIIFNDSWTRPVFRVLRNSAWWGGSMVYYYGEFCRHAERRTLISPHFV